MLWPSLSSPKYFNLHPVIIHVVADNSLTVIDCISNVSLWNGESLRLAGRPASRPSDWPAVYQTFSINHLSYNITLVPIYIFRAITFFYGATIFFKEKMAFLSQKIVMSCFLRNLHCSSSISRYVLRYIWGLD